MDCAVYIYRSALHRGRPVSRAIHSAAMVVLLLLLLLLLGRAAVLRMRLRTWDRFVLPFPFARLIYVLGDPIELPSDCGNAAIDYAREHLNHTPTSLTAKADRLSGRAPAANSNAMLSG
jgi:hypothetical protein